MEQDMGVADDPRRHELRCNDCGRFLSFAELCFSRHHFQPLSELGPEESWWSCPACRSDYGGRDDKSAPETIPMAADRG